MQDKYSDLDGLKRLDFDDLARILAEESRGTYFGSNEPTEEEKRLLGNEIFNDFLRKMRPHLCENGSMKYSEEADLIASIGDLVAGIYGKLPVLVVAVMIFKYGAGRICHDQE